MSGVSGRGIVVAALVVAAMITAPDGPVAAGTDGDHAAVGTWHRPQSCHEMVLAFEAIGLAESHREFMQGKFFPNGGPSEGDPCVGATSWVEQAKIFGADGFYEARSATGGQDDFGEVVFVDDDTLSFPTHARDFGYDGEVLVDVTVDGDIAQFTVTLPAGCAGACLDAHAWALTAFPPGRWQRGPIPDRTMPDVADTVGPGRLVVGTVTPGTERDFQVMALAAVDTDGTDPVPLTDGMSYGPAISPDGTTVAFTLVSEDGTSQIATIGLDGRDLAVLTSGPGVHESPAWSPDGAHLYYGHAPVVPWEEGFHTVLYRMAADGSDAELVGDPDAFDYEPKISPDGTQMLFQRWSGDGEPSPLIVRDLATGEERTVVARGGLNPDWSPDGTRIVMQTDPRDGAIRGPVVTIDASGDPASEMELHPGGSTEGGFKPAYSPDGRFVVFGCGSGAGSDAYDEAVCVVPADGSSPAEVVFDTVGRWDNESDWGALPIGDVPTPETLPATTVVPAVATGGEYTSTDFVVPFRVTVPEWAAAEPDQAIPNFVTFQGVDVDRGIRILAPLEVYAPPESAPGPVPDDYLAYLMAQTEHGATFSDVVETTVGGRPATVLTATTDRPINGSLGCQELGLESHDCFGLQPDIQLRIAVIDDGEQVVLIWVRDTKGSAAIEYDSFDDLLASVVFT